MLLLCYLGWGTALGLEGEFVVADGELVVENGEHTGALPGKVIRGPRYSK